MLDAEGAPINDPRGAHEMADGGSELTHADGPEIAKRPTAGFADVLCAIDGTPESLAAVGQAATLAGRAARLTLLAVTSFKSSGDHRGPEIGALETKQMLDAAVGIAAPRVSPAAGRQGAVGPFVGETAQGQLLEVVLALRLPGRFPRRLHRRQQQRNQDADDRNDHQKLYQREGAAGETTPAASWRPGR